MHSASHWFLFTDVRVVCLAIVALCPFHANAVGSDQSVEDAPSQGLDLHDTGEKLAISYRGQPMTDFVYRDAKTLRPYLANLHTLHGLQVTRHHPPVPSIDATDHETMHPGVWLAFGDINGHDFWRNQGRIEHLRFSSPPTVQPNELRFEEQSRLITADNTHLGDLTTRVDIFLSGLGWTVVWDTTFLSDQGDILFGDQEELGFGARVATGITEKQGGQIVSSLGHKSAAATWGQLADWCDYSGSVEHRQIGIMLMAAPHNFRSSWWHNRDYGLVVANPFGRAAMRQGEPSTVLVRRGETFRITFGAHIHDENRFEPTKAYHGFVQRLSAR